MFLFYEKSIVKNSLYDLLVLQALKKYCPQINYLSYRLLTLVMSAPHKTKTWALRTPIWSLSLLHAHEKQECIPVGCVPAARGGVCSGRCLLRGVCSGGVSAPGGLIRVVSDLGWCLLWGGLLPGGLLWGGLLWGGLLWGGWYTSMHWGRPPLWTEWQTGVKILPWPQLRCGR